MSAATKTRSRRTDYRYAPQLMTRAPVTVTWLKAMRPSARNERRLAQRELRKDRLGKYRSITETP